MENKHLNDFIQLKGHRVAYNKFINSINQKLATPVTTVQDIDHLDFRPFAHGEKQELYLIIAELLSVEGILKGDVNRRTIYQWLCDPEHTNLDINWPTMQFAVNHLISQYFNRN